VEWFLDPWHPTCIQLVKQVGSDFNFIDESSAEKCSLSCFLWRKVSELKAENSDQGGEVGWDVRPWKVFKRIGLDHSVEICSDQHGVTKHKEMIGSSITPHSTKMKHYHLRYHTIHKHSQISCCNGRQWLQTSYMPFSSSLYCNLFSLNCFILYLQIYDGSTIT
jgi:hypothetical protein